MPHHLWRGDISPFGGEAVVKPSAWFFQTHRIQLIYDGFAAGRGYIPSPQVAERGGAAFR